MFSVLVINSILLTIRWHCIKMLLECMYLHSFLTLLEFLSESVVCEWWKIKLFIWMCTYMCFLNALWQSVNWDLMLIFCICMSANQSFTWLIGQHSTDYLVNVKSCDYWIYSPIIHPSMEKVLLPVLLGLHVYASKAVDSEVPSSPEYQCLDFDLRRENSAILLSHSSWVHYHCNNYDPNYNYDII